MTARKTLKNRNSRNQYALTGELAQFDPSLIKVCFYNARQGYRVVVHLTSDHEVLGSNPTVGVIQFMTVRRYIAQSLSLPSNHRLVEINNAVRDVKQQIKVSKQRKPLPC